MANISLISIAAGNRDNLSGPTLWSTLVVEVEPGLQTLDEVYSIVRFKIINAMCQTLLYGIILCLVPIAIHVMVTNGLQRRARKWLLALTTSMFALSTVYWIFSVVLAFVIADLWHGCTTACYGSDNAPFCIVSKLVAIRIPAATWLAMFGHILLINYTIADGVIVWRAWVLCSDQSKIVLMIPVVMLAIDSAIYLMTVTMKVIQLLSEDAHIQDILSNLVNITEVAHLTLSLLINIFATSIIALKAWKYRKLLIESGLRVRAPTKAIRILTVLIESGMIHILVGVTSLASITIFPHFKSREMSSLFMPMGIQLAVLPGIYPIVVVLLVEKNRSLNSTYYSFGTTTDVPGARPAQTECMAFASKSV